MTRGSKAVLTGIAAAMLAAGSLMAGDRDEADAGAKKTRFIVGAALVGYQEVPAISTVASGHFRAFIDTEAQTITYKLTYEGLEGTITQSHVHFAQKGVNGGISFFLCTNAGNGPAGTPTCPEGAGEVEGVITPAQIIGPTGTGIEAGAFEEIVDAIRAGRAYANVHSTKWPAGEIRGQLH
jgi:hypothetical protein